MSNEQIKTEAITMPGTKQPQKEGVVLNISETALKLLLGVVIGGGTATFATQPSREVTEKIAQVEARQIVMEQQLSKIQQQLTALQSSSNEHQAAQPGRRPTERQRQ